MKEEVGQGDIEEWKEGRKAVGCPQDVLYKKRIKNGAQR